MGPYAVADYNLILCRLQYIYHGQPYARVDHNPMPESTLSPSQGLWIWPRFSEKSSLIQLQSFFCLPDCLEFSTRFYAKHKFHKVLIYMSTTVYVPSLELGLPHPFSRKRVCPPPPDQRVGPGGGHTRLRLKGWGSPNSNDWRNA
jgi:hypothetical protein